MFRFMFINMQVICYCAIIKSSIAHSPIASIEKLNLVIPRATIQAGIPNTRYPVHWLYDARLTHHIPTDAVMEWKKYKFIEDVASINVAIGAGVMDAKYSDLVSPNAPYEYAEGKRMSKKKGVSLTPSSNVGSGRYFNMENLEKCFENNRHYFLYETIGHTETELLFDIYWIPTKELRAWYYAYGFKGVIKYHHLMECIAKYPIKYKKLIR